jgi:Flp pilus assembly protein TadD
VLASVLAYWNSFEGTFVLDDIPAIVENPNIRSLTPISRAMKSPGPTTLSARPIGSLSFAVSYALTGSGNQGPETGLDPFAFHLLNLAIHIAAGLTLFGIVRRTFQSPSLRLRFAPHAEVLAGSIALLWLVHPLQTASVTYIVQRVEALAGLFLLLTLYCSIRALDSRAARGWSIAAMVACALGMGTKETMVGAPLIVLAWDWLFADPRELGPRRWRHYALLAATWLVLGWSVIGANRSASAGFGFAELPWWRYLITQAGVILHYLRLCIVPGPLVLDYGWPAAESVAAALPKVAAVVGLATLTVVGLINRSPLAFPGAIFFIVLAPSSSVLPIVTEVAAEHRMYVPLAAVLSLVVVGAFAAAQRLKAPKWSVSSAMLVLALLWGTLAHLRNRDYASEERIWADTIHKRPSNPRAHTNYGVLLLAQRRWSEAEPHLRTAVALNPREAKAHVALGAGLCSTDRCDEGILHLRRGSEINPNDVDAARNLAEAYAARGDLREAARNFKRALELVPDDVFMLNQASWLLATAPDDDVRDGKAALEMAERAVTLTRRADPTSLDSLGVAYAELDRFEDAQRAIEEALGAALRTGARHLEPELLNHRAMFRARQKIRAAPAPRTGAPQKS